MLQPTPFSSSRRLSGLIIALTLCCAFPMLAAKSSPSPSPTASPKTATASIDNPLLTESTLPFHYPPFDKIKNEHYAPAYEVALAQHLKEVEAIANQKDAPTFDNTLVSLERSGQTLDRVQSIFSNLSGANTNPEMQKIETAMAPKLSAHRDAIHLNSKLFARIQSLYDQREKLGLDPESEHLLERYHTDFVRAGAKLNDADKEKLKAMNSQLASLQTKFSQDVLKEKNASGTVVDDRKDLAGMDDNEIAAAASVAKAAKMEGKFLIAMQNTSGQPALSSLENRALREKIMKISLARNSHGGEFDTRETIKSIARLRAERAVLLGYENHAAYQLEDQTAKNVSTVNKLLADLSVPAVANAKKEAADLDAMIKKEGGDFPVASWDWSFYSEKVKKDRFKFDEAELKPYFELNHVVQDGVFYAANQLYGITFKERKDLPVYQPDVRVFEVSDADGKPLAIFIMDYYARPSKRGGAWMNEYVGQSGLLGTQPVVANHLNIPKPPAGQPTLLTFDEVTTAFHEFGHALHGMFSNVKYPRFSGTSVPRDFVEYPSQVNEMWAVWPSVLKNYAKQYKTGEPMPAELLQKMLDSQKFNEGFKTTEYLEASLLDQAWHQLKPSEIPTDAMAFEAQSLEKAGVAFDPIPPRYRSPYFSHSFAGGYSAGYYSYIWAEVLDADSVQWFKNHGGLTRENGDHFRKTLLSRGGSVDAMQLFKDFTGGGPDIQPLLERRGLAPASADTDQKPHPIPAEASQPDAK
ncbi:MAG: M3 family metallopeptidase [Chthoniobacterales bacterium]